MHIAWPLCMPDLSNHGLGYVSFPQGRVSKVIRLLSLTINGAYPLRSLPVPRLPDVILPHGDTLSPIPHF